MPSANKQFHFFLPNPFAFHFLSFWCFWTVVLEKTLENLLDCKEIKSISPKGNQSWIFIGRTDAEAETPIIWSPDAKNWLIGKNPDARKHWRQEEKGMTEDEIVGWHHRRDGHEFEQAPGVGDGQGSLECCSPWGHRESDTTEQLNWTDLKWSVTASSFFFATPHSLQNLSSLTREKHSGPQASLTSDSPPGLSPTSLTAPSLFFADWFSLPSKWWASHHLWPCSFSLDNLTTPMARVTSRPRSWAHPWSWQDRDPIMEGGELFQCNEGGPGYYYQKKKKSCWGVETHKTRQSQQACILGKLIQMIKTGPFQVS